MKRVTNTLFVVLMVFLTLVFSACSHEDPLLEDASGHAFYNYFDSYENLLKDPCSLSLCGGGGSGGGGVSSGRVDTGGKVLAILSSLAFDWLFVLTSHFLPKILKVSTSKLSNATIYKQTDIVELVVLQVKKDIQAGRTGKEVFNNIIDCVYYDEPTMLGCPRRKADGKITSDSLVEAIVADEYAPKVKWGHRVWSIVVSLFSDEPENRARERGYHLR